ncbi:helix-turn-helix domain-containing protein [Bacillus sp. sid0103]|uniref:helix-turn-helix transcriptional regulator n=1 Tax=Bacillus sp. sid0103 TaxID=2856337 RepID=UPI001C43ECEC|nr:helix-turn-helix transcriptional regulator [Bacillus sp. sid0103]MBV7508952.1 helix-turn-helix domain-containing protein [Bacillus sp. sid0103]
MKWFGIGKVRSKLGRYIDQHGISQKELEKSGVSRATISRLCSDDEHQPTISTARKIITFLKKLDSSVDYDNFFNM